MLNSLDLLFFFGRPFSPLYGLTMKLREKMYSSGVLRQHSLGVPVISVGNLVLGGTGKTPTVQHIARVLLQQGFRPAVVSRGYGGKAKKKVNIVSDGKSVLLSPILAGDEPAMLAESLAGVPVLTGNRRIFPCLHAIKQFAANVIILDDGFQHLSVKRDIDIVLFDGTYLAGNSRIFPGGPLREPISALNRCQTFLITGKTEANKQRTKQFSELLGKHFPDKKTYLSGMNNITIKQGSNTVSEGVDLGIFYGFCGIANPNRFKESLESSGIQLAAFHPLKDHTVYTQSLLSNICKKGVRCGAEKLITTEKDFVKLKNLDADLPIYVLQVQHKIDSAFDRYLIQALEDAT